MTVPPDWLRDFANIVASEIDCTEDISPLGCHFACVAGEWEITLFKGYLEVVGGPRDGTRHVSGFTLNIGQLVNLFDEVQDCWWQAQSMGASDDLGPHVAISGTYAGRNVWLRVLSTPPKRCPVGMVARTQQLAEPDTV